jgi:hypothetical protein
MLDPDEMNADPQPCLKLLFPLFESRLGLPVCQRIDAAAVDLLGELVVRLALQVPGPRIVQAGLLAALPVLVHVVVDLQRLRGYGRVFEPDLQIARVFLRFRCVLKRQKNSLGNFFIRKACKKKPAFFLPHEGRIFILTAKNDCQSKHQAETGLLVFGFADPGFPHTFDNV